MLSAAQAAGSPAGPAKNPRSNLFVGVKIEEKTNKHQLRKVIKGNEEDFPFKCQPQLSVSGGRVVQNGAP